MICTKDNPTTLGTEHTVTPRMTSTYVIDTKKGVYQVRTDYMCVHCGLEITGVQEASL